MYETPRFWALTFALLWLLMIPLPLLVLAFTMLP